MINAMVAAIKALRDGALAKRAAKLTPPDDVVVVAKDNVVPLDLSPGISSKKE
jgi:hypothetical protein